MAALSLRGRIFSGVAAVAVVTSVLMCIAVFLAYEDLERSMLQLVFSDEEAFFLAHLDTHGNHLETTTLDALFVPDGEATAIPPLFQGLPIPYLGELQRGNQSYLVHIEPMQGGTLYLSKDISAFEQRERLFRGMLALAVLLVLMIGIVLAHLTTRRIISPLARLARAVDRLVPGEPSRLERSFPTDFEERELRQIALPFAYYLSELDRLMLRERRLLAMASHELRTPVSTIAGALDVIDKRSAASGDPSTNSDVTRRALQRIRVATDEMRAQIDAILALARARAASSGQVTDMTALCGRLIMDLSQAGLATQRIFWQPRQEPVLVRTDPVLAKMLVRNLLQNTLQHTADCQIELTLGSHGLSVEDRGPGLPEAYLNLLGHSPDKSVPGEGGLGLYLVTLIAERLGWRISALAPAQGGTCVRVDWTPPG
jgi:signal transduction histidine kinase